MINGPLARKRSHHKKYLQHLKDHPPSKVCDFCDFKDNTERDIKHHTYFWVTDVMAQYDLWDNHGVKDQRMIVPKRHVEHIGEFSPEEALEYHAIVSQYDLLGYSLYQRAPVNNSRTIIHQHSHLISLADRQKKFVIYNSKPHITIY